MALTIENLAGYAAQSCIAASSMSAPEITRFACNLPHLSLTVHSFGSQFHRLCERSLVNLPQQNSNHTGMNLVITDENVSPSLSIPDWQGRPPGLGDIYECLEARGFDGSYEIDLKNWQFFSPEQGQGLYLLRETDAYPPWEAAFPLRNFLHWHYARQGRRLIHAASLGIDGRGVLLAGAGGAGKSGTTLAGVLNGLQSCGDDYIGLDINGHEANVFPVMRLMKQDPKGLLRLGLDANDPAFGDLNWQGKHEFDFEGLVPESRVEQLAIKAIFLPHIGMSKKSRITRATAREVMFSLMPNNLQQLPGRYKQGFNLLSQLSRQLPGYHLELSQDPKEISSTIAEFLSKDFP